MTAYDRCHCRPGCLAAVINGDDVVLGVDGYALTQHVMACPMDGVPGDYRKATVAHLLSFGYSVGALSTEAKLPHEDREDDEGEADTDDETGDASDEGAEADTVGVTCQVCNKKSNALTDGLCPKCAKNVGLPVAAEHVPEPATA